MYRTAVVDDLDIRLEIFGQQPIPIYTQICLAFPLVDTSSHSVIIKTLTDGLERLSASFPWVAGKIVNEESGEGNSGIFKIKFFEKIPRLEVKDLRHDSSIPAMDTLRRDSFPIATLDERIIAPLKTIAGELEGTADSSPVFLLQANFISGGLLLTFVSQHQAMDMTGQVQIMRLLSKACHNEQFTNEELSSGNLDRRDLVPLFKDSWEQGNELDHQTVKPTTLSPVSDSTNDHTTTSALPKCTWTSFTFHPDSLLALKSIATESITDPSCYVSTDDALGAFIWQSVIRARLPRFNLATKSKFARAVDARRYLDIPQTYPGLIMNMTYNSYTFQQLVEQPLGRIASDLRSAVDPRTSNLAYQTRSLATFMNRVPDKSVVSITASVDLSTDIMLSSWAKLDCYELDFNLGLGKPEAVRRPLFDPVESLAYSLPRRPDGEILVAICLRDEDLERLRADEEFLKYGREIG